MKTDTPTPPDVQAGLEFGSVERPCSVPVMRALLRAKDVRSLPPGDRYEPEDELVILADECIRLRAALEHIASMPDWEYRDGAERYARTVLSPNTQMRGG